MGLAPPLQPHWRDRQGELDIRMGWWSRTMTSSKSTFTWLPSTFGFKTSTFPFVPPINRQASIRVSRTQGVSRLWIVRSARSPHIHG